MTVPFTTQSLQDALTAKLALNFGTEPGEATDQEMLKACALVLRDVMALRGVQTAKETKKEQKKQVHYLSLEFLMGRSLMKNAYNLGVLPELKEALGNLGFKSGDLFELEPDAGLGNGETPIFPIQIFRVKEGVSYNPGDPNYDLKQLALECATKRMYPDVIFYENIVKITGSFKAPMGCRSFLQGWIDPKTGKDVEDGRMNLGVVTVNIPRIALESHGDKDRFWKIFDERLELCHRALLCRHERLMGTLSDAAPILWQYGALARLKKGETIDKLLVGGYSTISLGYAGLYECVKYMTGHSHTEKEGTPFAMAVMQRMNDKCAEWKAASDIDFSLYGTPLESTTYKFAKCLQKRFGLVPGITDRNYITNSYHVHVTEQIDAFTKLKFESDFQKLSPGGAISYVEVPNMQDNLEAVIKVMQFIYENIMYAELNTKSDYCQVCGYDGEIQIVPEDGKLVWECPKCHNRDQNKLNVARRTCGYIGTQFWNQGRTAEIKDRVLHL